MMDLFLLKLIVHNKKTECQCVLTYNGTLAVFDKFHQVLLDFLLDVQCSDDVDHIIVEDLIFIVHLQKKEMKPK